MIQSKVGFFHITVCYFYVSSERTVESAYGNVWGESV